MRRPPARGGSRTGSTARGDPLYTEDEIAALRRAIATGATRVEFVSGDTRRVVEYRSLTDMRLILAEMEAQVSGRSVQRAALFQRSRD